VIDKCCQGPRVSERKSKRLVSQRTLPRALESGDTVPYNSNTDVSLQAAGCAGSAENPAVSRAAMRWFLPVPALVLHTPEITESCRWDVSMTRSMLLSAFLNLHKNVCWLLHLDSYSGVREILSCLGCELQVVCSGDDTSDGHSTIPRYLPDILYAPCYAPRSSSGPWITHLASLAHLHSCRTQ